MYGVFTSNYEGVVLQEKQYINDAILGLMIVIAFFVYKMCVNIENNEKAENNDENKGIDENIENNENVENNEDVENNENSEIIEDVENNEQPLPIEHEIEILVPNEESIIPKYENIKHISCDVFEELLKPMTAHRFEYLINRHFKPHLLFPPKISILNYSKVLMLDITDIKGHTVFEFNKDYRINKDLEWEKIVEQLNIKLVSKGRRSITNLIICFLNHLNKHNYKCKIAIHISEIRGKNIQINEEIIYCEFALCGSIDTRKNRKSLCEW